MPEDKQNLDDITGDIDEQLKNLNDEERQNVLFQLTQINNYTGNLPDPEILGRYEKMVPGLAKKYFEDVIDESKFRRSIISKQQKSDLRYRTLGMILGFIIALILIGGSIFLLMNNHKVAGGLMGSAVIVGVLGIFVSPDSDDK